MKTDVPLKILFHLRAADLLVLTGDEPARLLSTDVVDLQQLKRIVDFVFKLQMESGDTYFRHLEFQAEADPEMAERCFRYNTQMILQYRVPMVTTVIYLKRSAALAEPVFRVTLAGREINRWQFESLQLWEVEGKDALAAGLPGLLALVPLMKGTDLTMIEASVRQIEEKAPAGQRADLLTILYTFAEGRYDIQQIQRIIGREKLMQSTLYQEALAEGHLEKCRKLCAAVLHKWHPMLPAEVFQAIADCTNEELLDELILNAPEWSADEIRQRLLLSNG